MKQFALTLFMAVVTLGTTTAIGQSGQLSGLVKDKTNAAVPSASVTLSNIETGATFISKSGKEGLYVFASVPPGRYSLWGEAAGFGKTVISDIKIDVAAYVSQDIVLQVKSASEMVNVNSAPSQLAQTTGAVSTVIDRPLIGNIPLNGNSLQTLFELTPGVILNVGGSPANGGGMSVNGQRPTSNYLSVDGAGANIFQTAGFQPNATGAGIPTSASGGTNGILPVDAVEEYRMQTSSYSAEYGRTPGGQIEVKTRGGTNEFHGGVFEHFRNQVLDSTDWFITHNHENQAPLRMNDFGGTFGGPLWKNHVFFFAAHETLLLHQPQPSATIDVPDQPTRQGAASVFAPYLQVFPVGNGGPDPNAQGFDLYNQSGTVITTDHSTSVRVDARMPKNSQAFVRWNEAPSFNATTNIPTNNQGHIDIRTITVGFNTTITPSMNNALTVNYSKTSGYTRQLLISGDGADPSGVQKALSGISNPDVTQLQFHVGRLSLFVKGPSTDNRLSQYNLLDTYSLAVRRHTLRFGVDYLWRNPFMSQPTWLTSWYTNVFSATGLANGMVDVFNYGGYVSNPNLRMTNFSLFANDSWRLTNRLTLDYGFRWELNPPPTASGPGLLAIAGNPNVASSITTEPAGTSLYKTRYNNVAPRFGFAYSLDSQHLTVIRGAAGIFYDTGQATTAAQAAQASYPYQSLFPQVRNISYASLPAYFTNLPNAVSLPQYSLYTVDPHLRSPAVYSWSLTLERQLQTKVLASVSYVGNAGSQLLKQNEYFGLNPQLTTGPLYVYTNGEHSQYQALQTQLRGRMGSGFDLLASYVYSHAIDSGSSDFVSVGGFAKNYRADADFDIRHSFSAGLHYQSKGPANNNVLRKIIGGWSFDSIVLLQGAAPFSVTASNADVNSFSGYADVVPGVPVMISSPNYPGGRALNGQAFSVPPSTRDGTSARNAYRLFGLVQWDLGVGHDWKLWESGTFNFRIDAFNIVNHPNFAEPVGNCFGSNPGDACSGSTFGQSIATYASSLGGTDPSHSGLLSTIFMNGGARSVQLSGRQVLDLSRFWPIK